ncbi:MAG: hypothetical protein V4671_07950 [Armatimonadota bacterium]
MNQENTPAPLPVLTSSRFRRPFWIGLGAVALILIGLGTFIYLVSVGVHMSNGWMTVAQTLPAEQKAARKQGLPLQPEDLWRVPPVAPDKNAAVLYRRIDTLYRRDSEASRNEEGEALSEFLKRKTRDKRRRQVEGILRRRQKMIRLAQQAANLTVCDYDRPWEQGFNTTFGELVTMRHLARLFAASAILNKEIGKPEAALQDVAYGAKIGVHAAQDRFLIAFLVRIALQAIMNQPFVEILQKYGDNTEVLRLAEETQASFGATPNLRDCYLAENVMTLVQMETYRDPQVPTPNGISKATLPILNESTRSIQVDAWESRLIAFWRQMDSGIRDSGGNLRKGQMAWKRIMERENKLSESPGYEMNALLVPVFDKVPEKTMLIEANYQLRNQMIALLQHRIKTQTFPQTLDILPKGKRFFDPFNNEPLIYHKTTNGFILYSVGANLKDNGGDETRDKDKYQRDIVVRYP